MNWQAFLGGLESAAATGALTGFTQALMTGQKVGLGTLTVAGVGALMGVVNYLKQSPLFPNAPVPPAK